MGFLDTLSRVAGAAMEKMEDINEQMEAEGKTPAEGKQVLQIGRAHV